MFEPDIQLLLWMLWFEGVQALAVAEILGPSRWWRAVWIALWFAGLACLLRQRSDPQGDRWLWRATTCHALFVVTGVATIEWARSKRIATAIAGVAEHWHETTNYQDLEWGTLILLGGLGVFAVPVWAVVLSDRVRAARQVAATRALIWGAALVAWLFCAAIWMFIVGIDDRGIADIERDTVFLWTKPTLHALHFVSDGLLGFTLFWWLIAVSNVSRSSAGNGVSTRVLAGLGAFFIAGLATQFYAFRWRDDHWVSYDPPDFFIGHEVEEPMLEECASYYSTSPGRIDRYAQWPLDADFVQQLRRARDTSTWVVPDERSQLVLHADASTPMAELAPLLNGAHEAGFRQVIVAGRIERKRWKSITGPYKVIEPCPAILALTLGGVDPLRYRDWQAIAIDASQRTGNKLEVGVKPLPPQLP
jgi:hypothetical protein